MQEAIETEDKEGLSLINIIAFFLRLRKKMLFTIIVASLASLAIYLLLPINMVPSVYKLQKYAQLRVYYHIPDPVLANKMTRTPRMFLEQLIYDVKQLSGIILTAYNDSKHIPITPDQALEIAKEIIDGKQLTISFDARAISPNSAATLDLKYPDTEFGIILLRYMIYSVNSNTNKALKEDASASIKSNYALLSTMDKATKVVEGDRIKKQILAATPYLENLFGAFWFDYIRVETVSLDKRSKIIFIIMTTSVCLVIVITLFSNFIASIKNDPKATAKLKAALGKNDETM